MEQKANQQQQQQQFQCVGNCLKCSAIQRQYCSSQNTYNTMRMLQDMMVKMDAMQAEITLMKNDIKAIQGNEASIFSIVDNDDALVADVEESKKGLDIAQKGSGAKQEIDSQEKLLTT